MFFSNTDPIEEPDPAGEVRLAGEHQLEQVELARDDGLVDGRLAREVLHRATVASPARCHKWSNGYGATLAQAEATLTSPRMSRSASPRPHR